MPRMRGALPSPRHRLAGATPHKIVGETPAQILWKPPFLSMWLNATYGDCVTAEEAFAKGIGTPPVFISDDTVLAFATKNNLLNGADLITVLDLMQTAGFDQYTLLFNNGKPSSVDWTDSGVLQNAISQGPVKIGVAADQLENAVPNPPTNGWFATGFTADPNEDHCVSLCGYGPASWLSRELGVSVSNGTDEVAYAMFTWDSIGIIDWASLQAICAEAWLRNPVTVLRT
jgi:hypothetical protein